MLKVVSVQTSLLDILDCFRRMADKGPLLSHYMPQLVWPTGVVGKRQVARAEWGRVGWSINPHLSTSDVASPTPAFQPSLKVYLLDGELPPGWGEAVAAVVEKLMGERVKLEGPSTYTTPKE